MTEEPTNNIQSMEVDMTIMNGQIRALAGLVTHLLCLSTIHLGIDSGNPNFDRVAEDMEGLASAKTAQLTEGDDPAVAAVAERLQKGIFKTVRSQLKKEVQILKVAAMNEHRRH